MNKPSLASVIAARRYPISSIACAIAAAFNAGSTQAANFTVLNANDAGPDSLRAAILLANGSAGADTVTFSGVTGVITLTTGEIPITGPVTITGPGAGVLTVSGNHSSRIFNIGASSATTITGLTLANGLTSGDGEAGGAINSLSELALVNSTVTGSATGGTDSYGGGVYVKGNLTLTGSTVSGNKTTGYNARGGGLNAGFGNITLTNSAVLNNSTAGAYAYGGGIYSHKNLTLTDSTVTGNSTKGRFAGGGGIYMTDSGGDLLLRDSTVSGNSTSGEFAYGGGVGAGGDANTVINSTISGNSTSGNDAGGGGIAVLFDDIVVINSTIAFNTSQSGVDGIDFSSFGQLFTADNNLILQEDPAEVACGKAVTSGGTNRATDASCAGGTVTTLEAVRLDGLANNGGQTKTHALGRSSIAVNAGNGTVCATPGTVNNLDQRGVARPPGLCDIGAFELAPSCDPTPGTCTSVAFPKASFKAKDDPNGPAKDSVSFSASGTSTVANFFGDPAATTINQLCVYKLSMPQDLLLDLRVGAAEVGNDNKPRWKHKGSPPAAPTKFTNAYANPKGNADGATRLRQVSGATAKVAIKGRGANLELNAASFPADGILVQQRNSDGNCATVTFPSVTVDTAKGTIKAAIKPP